MKNADNKKTTLIINIVILVVLFISWLNIINLNWNPPSSVKELYGQDINPEVVISLKNQTIKYIILHVSISSLSMIISLFFLLLINLYLKNKNSRLKLLIYYELKLIASCTLIMLFVMLIPNPYPNIMFDMSYELILFYNSLVITIDAIILSITIFTYLLFNFSRHDEKRVILEKKF